MWKVSVRSFKVQENIIQKFELKEQYNRFEIETR